MSNKRTFTVPALDEVSPTNRAIFGNLNKGLGFVPSLYVYYAKNKTALAGYLTLQNRKSTLKAKEREVINLVTSQINGCRYCQSAHTAFGKMNDLTENQKLELRAGSASCDNRIDALAKLAKSVVENRGHSTEKAKEAFFLAGYTEASLIDAVIVIGDKIISIYIHPAGFAIDFPVAPKLDVVAAKKNDQCATSLSAFFSAGCGGARSFLLEPRCN